MSSRSSTQVAGKIAVIGDRELALGYRLLGVDDTFIVSESEAVQTVTNIFNSDQFSLIIIADQIRKKLPRLLVEKLEASLAPLVIFMPSPSEESEEESLAALAKRVLGIDLKVA
ncbi:MAG: V-type ATP synthase subunit F [Conexivisphaerales archaeon]